MLVNPFMKEIGDTRMPIFFSDAKYVASKKI